MIEVSVIWLALPNGDSVLQRRDNDAEVSPGLLGFFGGHLEAGETPEVAMKRELAEETSLNVSDLNIRHIASVEIPRPDNPSVMRKVHVYKTDIDSDNFEVFEGERSETYSIADLKERHDLSASAKYVIDYLSNKL